VHWTKKGEVNPSEKLIAECAGVFDPFRPQSKWREFAEFRSDLKLLVSPVGGAVNKGNNFSSYNATCDRHLTEDRSDSGTGLFLYYLLTTDLRSGPSVAVELLRQMPRIEGCDWVFPGTKNKALSDMSLTAVLRRMGRDNITVHGMRSTFRDWASESSASSFGREAAEHALAHSLPDKVEAAYRRGDQFERRVGLMQAWADYCATSSATAATVTPIRGAVQSAA